MAKPLAKLLSMLAPKRRWAQFRLRTLFVMVAVAALPCCWLVWKIEAKRRERAVVAEVEKVGGFIQYDWERADKVSPYGPAWLRSFLGDDFFSNVVEIDLDNYDMGPNDTTDQWLTQLEALTELSTISIDSPYVTDAGVRFLAKFKKLTTLGLTSSAVTDAGLGHIEKLHDLQALGLSGTRVTDAGLVHLYGLAALRDLGLYGTVVTDGGVAVLQRTLPRCKIHR